MITEWSGFILFMVISIGVGVCSVFASRKFIGHEFLRRHNEVTAPVHAAISVMYAVLLGFVMIATWEHYDQAEGVVVTEANQIFALDRDFSNIPFQIRSEIDSALSNYTHSVINVEWNMMMSGSMDNYSNSSYETLWKIMSTLTPQDDSQKMWVDKAVDRINKLDEARGERFMLVERHIPRMLWRFLLAGGCIVILFTSLFGSETLSMSLLTSIPLAMLIGFMLYLINELDYPFNGNLRIHDEAFRHVLELIQRTH
jgi:uncharacterized membrane protein YraQ (UPF0718 family)